MEKNYMNEVMQFIQREAFLAGKSEKKVCGLFLDDDTYNMFLREPHGMVFIYKAENRQELFGYPVDRIRSQRHIVIVEFNDGTAKVVYPYLGKAEVHA